MGDIKFEFNLDKLIHAIAFFFAQGISDLTKLKVAKLLYFADKKHLLEHGTPILGDVYFCMDYGPVPSFALNEMSDAIERSGLRDGESDYTKMGKVLRVRRPGLFSSQRHPRFEAKCAYDSGVFSDSELMVLAHTAKHYGGNTAYQLVELTHQEPTWKIPNETRAPHGRESISYELFFEGAPPEARRYLAKLKADFCGQVISLAGDRDYQAFGEELRTYNFEPSLDVDSDQMRPARKVTYSA